MSDDTNEEMSKVAEVQQKSTPRRHKSDDRSPSRLQRPLPSVTSKSSQKKKKIAANEKEDIPKKENLNDTKKAPVILTKTNSPESIQMTSNRVSQKKATAIPAHISKVPDESGLKNTSSQQDTKMSLDQQVKEEDGSSDDLSELRDRIKMDWWDEEASGLPRSVSQRSSSRVSRAMLQESNVKQLTSRTIKKKELSWNDDGYLDVVVLKSMEDPSRALNLDRKASISPFKSATAFGRASGITICVPKKSCRNINRKDTDTVINISISKKSLGKSKSAAVVTNHSDDLAKREKRAVRVEVEIPYIRIFKIVQSKLSIVRNKLRSVRNLTS